MADPAAVILAAGAGERLGGVAKALIERGGQTFLARIAATARAAGLGDAVVVVGPPFGDRVAAHARALGLAVVDNPEPQRGMASSVALGFAALSAALAAAPAAAAWLWPVDHPDVELATLRRLITGRGEHAVAQPRHAGRGGHPPLIARALWPALAACGTLPAGARSVLASADVIAIAVDDAGVIRDVDTPGDLERA